MSYTPEQLARLPKWAQHEISRRPFGPLSFLDLPEVPTPRDVVAPVANPFRPEGPSLLDIAGQEERMPEPEPPADDAAPSLPEGVASALKVSAFLVGRDAMALAEEYLRRGELVTAARWAGTAAAYGAPGGKELLAEIETHLDAGIPGHRPTPGEARMITKTDTIRDETVTTTVDIDDYDVAVGVAVRGVTWTSNARAAARQGLATIWEAAIDGFVWRLWSPHRHGSMGPHRWLVAWNIFEDGDALPGEFYAQEAIVVATKHIQTRNQTVPEEGKRE